MSETAFFTVENVLELHSDTLRHEGGLSGVRDRGLLESAVMMPQQQFEGEYLHPDLASQAAAYLYHLAQNHAFHDGNKRIAAGVALVFLRRNGAVKLPTQEEMERVTLAVASGEMSKEAVTQWLRGVVG